MGGSFEAHWTLWGHLEPFGAMAGGAAALDGGVAWAIDKSPPSPQRTAQAKRGCLHLMGWLFIAHLPIANVIILDRAMT